MKLFAFKNSRVKKDIIITTLLVFVWGSLCLLIVRAFSPVIAAIYVMPMQMPSNSAFDMLWLLVYILIMVSIQLFFLDVKNNNDRKLFLYVLGISAVSNVLMYVGYYIVQIYIVTFFITILNFASIFYLVRLSWKVNRTSSVLLLPYLMVSLLSLYSLFFFIVENWGVIIF